MQKCRSCNHHERGRNPTFIGYGIPHPTFDDSEVVYPSFISKFHKELRNFLVTSRFTIPKEFYDNIAKESLLCLNNQTDKKYLIQFRNKNHKILRNLFLNTRKLLTELKDDFLCAKQKFVMNIRSFFTFAMYCYHQTYLLAIPYL